MNDVSATSENKTSKTGRVYMNFVYTYPLFFYFEIVFSQIIAGFSFVMLYQNYKGVEDILYDYSIKY